MIYLDNAATSFPKPERVIAAVSRYCREIGANPGRASHRLAREASAVVGGTRRLLAALLGGVDPSRLIFTPSATVALNLAMKGLLRAGDHVLTSGMEHNSVLRPLHQLENRGITHTRIRCTSEGLLDPADIRRHLRPETRLIVLVHASNVTGGLMPVAEVGALARELGILFLVDAAQTVGAIPVEPEQLSIDLLAGPGHKGLLGPMGTGFLYVKPGLDLDPLWEGGTGSSSESMEQPETWPDRFEGGTLNAPGLAGLAEGIAEVHERGPVAIAAHKTRLMEMLYRALRELPGLILYGPANRGQCVGTLSFNVEGVTSNEVAHMLDSAYEIAVRPGLHCAPAAHQTLGSFPQGTVRVSVGPYNTEDDILTLIRAVEQIARLRH
jgi:cysteine desulfurase/selenocysteine lyase